MVVTFKKTSRDRSDELKNIALKSTKTFSVQNGTIWLVPFDDCRWKENFLQKLCLVLTGGVPTTFLVASEDTFLALV